eukprot:TCONS_00072455-protein
MEKELRQEFETLAIKRRMTGQTVVGQILSKFIHQINGDEKVPLYKKYYEELFNEVREKAWCTYCRVLKVQNSTTNNNKLAMNSFNTSGGQELDFEMVNVLHPIDITKSRNMNYDSFYREWSCSLSEDFNQDHVLVCLFEKESPET